MNILQPVLDSAIQDILDHAGDVSEEELLSTIEKAMPSLVENTARSVLSAIKSDMDDGLKEKTENRQRFEQRLIDRWQKPLSLLELLVSIVTEVGHDFNDSFRDDAARSNDYRFDVLMRLQARASKTASAILVLLRSGHADDACARWRTLHEIAVVSWFIKDANQDVAERYLLHEIIHQYKAALQLQRYASRLNESPLSQFEFNRLETRRNCLVAKYGKPFKENYGWAASALKKNSPSFADIEDAVDLEHWRPYFKMASDNTHANAHGMMFQLGIADHQIGKVMLAGPSNAGLADPGHWTAISLQQVTLNLLTTKTSLDSVVVMLILEELQDEIGDAFLEAHRALEAEIQKNQGV
ncbi:MAG: hypothetical protein F4Y63_07230 [Chloroflexi bacterium]|nr:hypothetical protein [Chloroflexota bacterium]MYK61253.1 hypothetical protein [Chloroflexota bacterium]